MKIRNKPPFTITPAIIDLVALTGEAVGRLSVLTDQEKKLHLHRINRIQTIQGSLAIEGNTLSAKQITAILDGKRVIAPEREIREVTNANRAYALLKKWYPDSETDLLDAHRILMNDLAEDAGVYRHGGVGVMAGNQILHMAPPADRVPRLMHNLFLWLADTDQHPLISSSVFHYEFEFIHPFSDGNGRLGRLWQTVMLYRWNPLFENISVESLIHKHQQEYYYALQKSTDLTDSAPFIEFMLKMILDSISAATPQDSPHVNPHVNQLMEVLKGEMSRGELQQALGLNDRKSFRERYIVPALKAGLIEMTLPDKPKSRFQKYRKL